MPESRIPGWINLALGYGADGMIGGSDNSFKNPDGTLNTEYLGVARTREFYLSPDIDFTRIPTDSRALKVLFTVMNCYKLPFPALAVSTSGQVGIDWIR